jgi:hypothetical protein
MHLASRCSSVFRNALLASCLLVVGIAGSAIAQGPAPSCEISGPTSVFVNEPFELCGIAGTGLTYTWADENLVVINHDRCLNFPNGIPTPGSYDFEFTISQGPDYLKCPVTIVVRERPDLECEIKVEEKCGSAELCGPDGYEYYWTGPGVTGETTQCVTVTESGSYSLEITNTETDQTGVCRVELELKKDCGENCPRTPGYWGQQARQRDNGSTKFSRAQVIAIAECISARVDVFSWGTGEAALAAFNAVVNPSNPMTNQKQVKRHLSALLANICATGVSPVGGGGDVFLDGSTVVSCNGESMTIDELIDAVDDELTGASPDYGLYIDCLDKINNRIGIPLAEGCRADEVKTDSAQKLGGSLQTGGLLVATELSFSATNPAQQTSTLRFSLPADGEVSVKVFDVAGRQVANLGGGFTAAGSHTLSWDVRGVARGLYFARLVYGGQIRTQQIVVTH